MSVKLGELDLAASQIPTVGAGGQGTQSLGQMPGIKSACVPDGVNECREMCAGVRVHHGWVATYNSVSHGVSQCGGVWPCLAPHVWQGPHVTMHLWGCISVILEYLSNGGVRP